MIRNGSKWIISTNGGLEMLQSVLELDIEWCVSEDARASKGVDCEILHQLEGGTKYSL